MMSFAPTSAFSSVSSRALAWLVIALVLLAGPRPLRAADAVSADYRLQPQDLIIVDVVGEPTLSKEFRISASGEINYPFLGNIRVADKTTSLVAQEVKAGLEADYLVNAQVIVQVRDFRKSLVFVYGQVNKPGAVEIPPERKLSLIEAITMAMGFTRLAKTSDVQVSRAGETERLRFDVDDLRKNNDPTRIFFLEPGDQVFVPEARF
ncbi:MAG: polysaccharide biosynthesis/export family protein [Limisphaerales bacterium]